MNIYVCVASSMACLVGRCKKSPMPRSTLPKRKQPHTRSCDLSRSPRHQAPACRTPPPPPKAAGRAAGAASRAGFAAPTAGADAAEAPTPEAAKRMGPGAGLMGGIVDAVAGAARQQAGRAAKGMEEMGAKPPPQTPSGEC